RSSPPPPSPASACCCSRSSASPAPRESPSGRSALGQDRRDSVSVIVIVNPRSRANLRDVHIADRLGDAIGAAGRVIQPHSLEEMADTARSLAKAPPQVLAIHGGDGTL